MKRATTAVGLRFITVVPLDSNPVELSEYNKVMYRQHNEIERLLGRLKESAVSFSCFEETVCKVHLLHPLHLDC